MALETAQLLCSAIHYYGYGSEAPYKATHINHPCSVWSRQTSENFGWLKKHGIAICKEYTFRYGKIHKCESVIIQCNEERIPQGQLQKFALAMPDQYKGSDPVNSYRLYYLGEKREIAKWSKRSPPEWWRLQ